MSEKDEFIVSIEKSNRTEAKKMNMSYLVYLNIRL